MIPAIQRLHDYMEVLRLRKVERVHQERVYDEMLTRERVKRERLKRIQRNRELNLNGQNIDEEV